MIIERAELSIKADQAAEFEKAMESARQILLDAEGCHSVFLARGIEDPAAYLLILEWDSVAAHERFSPTEACDVFRGLVRPYAAGPARVGHFQPL